jgi:IS1 family transposase
MNKLPPAKRIQILSLLCEGASMRSVSRLADVSINTVSKLLVDAGRVCAEFHDEKVRGVRSKRVQVDEIWSFTYAKQKQVKTAKKAPEGAGDTWTWTAIDADSKLIISYLVGGRDGEYALAFMDDVRGRLANRVQMTTDGLKAYLVAVEEAFGADIDYAQLVKLYGPAQGVENERRYSPAECIGAKRVKIEGNPNYDDVSTSYVERHNLSIRMGNRRFTRLTNAFSKKLANHIAMLSLYFVHYNFCRMHKTLRCTPAQEAGLVPDVKNMEWVVSLIDARAPMPGKRSSYKKRGDENSK